MLVGNSQIYIEKYEPRKKGMERIGGGKRKRRKEKEGGENSPLVKDRQGSTGTEFVVQ
jgi:hypothetical protein